MLEVQGLKAGYGLSQVLFDMHLSIEQGQVVSLIGRNGMGKTTTVKSIMGLLKPSAGRNYLGRRINTQRFTKEFG